MRRQKAGLSGIAAGYISRTRAIRKLQLSLKDFRRLCILKGIFPRDPKKLPSGGNSKTFYSKKDILFLSHEPLLKKFRDLKTFLKKHTRALSKQDTTRAKSLSKNKPKLSYDHLVKERYPSFIDAIRDMDDALCMVNLYANLPSGTTDEHDGDRSDRCSKLSKEFQLWVMRSQSLRKVFVSIKGLYYQASINGQLVTWNTPYNFSQQLPHDVDYRVLLTFLDFYETCIKFINFKLYHDVDLYYPPKIDQNKENQGYCFSSLQIETLAQAQSRIAKEKDARELAKNNNVRENDVAPVTKNLKNVVKDLVETESKIASTAASQSSTSMNVDVVDSESFAKLAEQNNESDFHLQESLQSAEEAGVKSVFNNCVILLGRETLQDSLEFVICCGGGKVIREITGQKLDFALLPKITHQIIDRPVSGQLLLERVYVQPQWVYDSFNTRACLPVAPYAPGATLPPHLSPFVDDVQEGYIPAQRNVLREWAGQTPLELESEDLVGPLSESSKKLSEKKSNKKQVVEEDDEQAYARELAKEKAGKSYNAEESEEEEEIDEGESDEDVEEEDSEDENKEVNNEEDSDDDEAEAAREAAFEARLTAKRQKTLNAHKNLTPDEQHKEFAKVLLTGKNLKAYNKAEVAAKKKIEDTQILREKRSKIEASKAAPAETRASGKRKNNSEVPVAKEITKKSKPSKK